MTIASTSPVAASESNPTPALGDRDGKRVDIPVINICSCGSSGSTLLARTLDRHPDITCGDELFLFSTPALYEHFDRVKQWRHVARVLGISGNPHDQGRAIFRNAARYGLTRGRLWRMLGTSRDLRDLAQRVREHVLALTGKSLWAEKTPRNIRMIHHFFDVFPDGRMIAIVRDPRDVVSSLLGRDKGVLQAVEAWMRSVACIQPFHDDERLLVIRYEDLCADNNAVLRTICDFVGVDFDPAVFETEAHASAALGQFAGHSSWQSTPDSGFSTASIGRWRETDLDVTAMARVRLTAGYAALLGTGPWTVAALARAHGYDYDDPAPVTAGVYTAYESERGCDPVRRAFDSRMGVQPYINVVEYPADAPPERGRPMKP